MRSILLLFLFASSVAMAGDRAGNGGDVVVCFEQSTGEVKSVELLDVFESSVRKIPYKLSSPDISQAVSDFFSRFKRIDPIGSFVAKAYSGSLLNSVLQYENNPSIILDDVEFTSLDLKDVSDSYEIALPKGCEVKQLIIYRPQRLSREKTFFISKELWSKMDSKNKAAAVIHEALYMYFYNNGWSDSRFARYINNIVNSDESENYTVGEYIQDSRQSQNANKPFYMFLSYPMKITGIRYEMYATMAKTPQFVCLPENRAIANECISIESDAIFELMNHPAHKNQQPFHYNSKYSLFPIKVLLRENVVVGYEAIVVDRNFNLLKQFTLGSTTFHFAPESRNLKEAIDSIQTSFNYDSVPVVQLDLDGEIVRLLSKTYVFTTGTSAPAP